MSKLDEYINMRKNSGEVDKDGAYGYQCIDLYNDYSEYMFGAHNVGADFAKNVVNNQNVYNYYDRIDNYPEFIPQKGDVAVWLGGQSGHIAICFGQGDVKGFKTLDQNWVPQKLTEQWHDYTYMGPLVFLRPKDQSGMNDPIPEPEPQPVEPQKSVDELAQEVIAGKWGNGEDRKNNLENAGYDYGAIQNRVNEMLSAQETIEEIRVGDKVKVLNATQYNGQPFKTWYDVYDVIEVAGDRVVIGIGNEVTCAININNIQKV